MVTMAADSIFIDTNILVFADLTGSPYHDIARKRLVSFHDAGHTLWISRQIIREYLVAITRGQSFSAPVSPRDAATAARVIAAQLRVASDTPEVGGRLLELIEQFGVMGKQVHDARWPDMRDMRASARMWWLASEQSCWTDSAYPA